MTINEQNETKTLLNDIMTAILEHGDGNCKEARDKCVNEIVRNGIGAADWSNELHAMLFLREHRFLTSRTILKNMIEKSGRNLGSNGDWWIAGIVFSYNTAFAGIRDTICHVDYIERDMMRDPLWISLMNDVQNLVSIAFQLLTLGLQSYGRKIVSDGNEHERNVEKVRWMLTTPLQLVFSFVELMGAEKVSEMQRYGKVMQSAMQIIKQEILKRVFICEWTAEALPILIEIMCQHSQIVRLEKWNQLQNLVMLAMSEEKVLEMESGCLYSNVMRLLSVSFKILSITRQLGWATLIRVLLRRIPLIQFHDADKRIDSLTKQYYVVLPHLLDSVKESMHLAREHKAHASESEESLILGVEWQDIVLTLHIMKSSAPILYSASVISTITKAFKDCEVLLKQWLYMKWTLLIGSNGKSSAIHSVDAWSPVLFRLLESGESCDLWKVDLIIEILFSWMHRGTSTKKEELIMYPDMAEVASFTLVAIFETVPHVQEKLLARLLNQLLQLNQIERPQKRDCAQEETICEETKLAKVLSLLVSRCVGTFNKRDLLTSHLPTIQEWLTRMYGLGSNQSKNYFQVFLPLTSVENGFFQFILDVLKKQRHSLTNSAEDFSISLCCACIEELLRTRHSTTAIHLANPIDKIFEELQYRVSHSPEAHHMCFSHIANILKRTDILPVQHELTCHSPKEASLTKDASVIIELYIFVSKHLLQLVRMFKIGSDSKLQECDNAVRSLSSAHLKGKSCHDSVTNESYAFHEITCSTALAIGETLCNLLKSVECMEKYIKCMPKQADQFIGCGISALIQQFVSNTSEFLSWVLYGCCEGEDDASLELHNRAKEATAHMLSQLTRRRPIGLLLWSLKARVSIALTLITRCITSLVRENESKTIPAQAQARCWFLLDIITCFERILITLSSVSNEMSSKYIVNQRIKQVPQAIALKMLSGLNMELGFTMTTKLDLKIPDCENDDTLEHMNPFKTCASREGILYTFKLLSNDSSEQNGEECADALRLSIIFYGGILGFIRKASSSQGPTRASVISLSTYHEGILSKFPAPFRELFCNSSKHSAGISPLLDSPHSFDSILSRVLATITNQAIAANRFGNFEAFVSFTYEKKMTIFSVNVLDASSHQRELSYSILGFLRDLDRLMDTDGMEKAQLAYAQLIRQLLICGNSINVHDAEERTRIFNLQISVATKVHDLLCTHKIHQPQLLRDLLQLALPCMEEHDYKRIAKANDQNLDYAFASLCQTMESNCTRLAGILLVCDFCADFLIASQKVPSEQDDPPKTRAQRCIPLSRKRLIRALVVSDSSGEDESTVACSKSADDSADCVPDIRLPLIDNDVDKLMAVRCVLQYIDKTQSLILCSLVDTDYSSLQEEERLIPLLQQSMLLIKMLTSIIAIPNKRIKDDGGLMALILNVSQACGDPESQSSKRASANNVSKTLILLLGLFEQSVRILRGHISLFSKTLKGNDKTDRSAKDATTLCGLHCLLASAEFALSGKRMLQEIKSYSNRSFQSRKLAAAMLKFNIFQSELTSTISVWRQILNRKVWQDLLQTCIERITQPGLTAAAQRPHTKRKKQEFWVGTIPMISRRNKKRIRSRHSYIDECLREESGDDAYADLEDFIA